MMRTELPAQAIADVCTAYLQTCKEMMGVVIGSIGEKQTRVALEAVITIATELPTDKEAVRREYIQEARRLLAMLELHEASMKDWPEPPPKPQTGFTDGL